MSNKEWLQNRVKVWQERLGLDDWSISASWVSQWELGDCDTEADIDFWPDRKAAEVRILKLEDWRTGHPKVKYPESLIVHELVHLLTFWCMPQSEDGEEVCVWQITKSLLKGYRGGKGEL